MIGRAFERRGSDRLRRVGARSVAYVVLSALFAAGLSALPGGAAVAEDGVVDATEVADEAAAVAVAKKYGHAVAVGELRSEFNETVANPDGTLTLTAFAQPQRVRRGDGFVPLDTTLSVNAGGSVSPVAALSDLRLSGGGPGPLLTLTRGGKGVTLTAPWTLPAPILSGSAATYANVMPDVDLQIVASAGGYRQILVVKSAAAAANPALTQIAWGIDGVNATVRDSAGMVQVVDGTGEILLASDTPAMWDSPAAGGADGVRAMDEATSADADAVAEPHRVESMPVTVSDNQMVVSPNTSMLTAADTVFPLFIDPSLSPATPFDWTMVSSSNPNTAEYNYNNRDRYRVGVQYNTSNIWRTHLGFNIGTMAGGTVYSAGMNVTAYHTNLCTGSDVELWQAYAISNYQTYTWYNDSDNDLIVKIDTQHFSANKGACPKADDPGTFGGTLVAELQSHVSNRYSTMTFAFKGQTESSDNDWTLFNPGATSLSVVYDHTPSVPTELGISKTTTCPDTALLAGAVIVATAPTLCAKPQDIDGGSAARVEFEVWNTTHTSRLAYSNGSVTNRTVGQFAPWTVTPALGQGAVDWRVQSCDAHTCGAWSVWWRFTVDTLPPSTPVTAAVSGGSATYQPKSTGLWAGGIGVAGNFTFTASSDASSIEVQLNGVSRGWKTTTGGVLSDSIAPTKDGVNTLQARSKDTAGNTGGWSASFEFLVAPAVNKSWRWEFNNALTSIDTAGSTITNPGAYPVSGFTPTYSASPASQAIGFNGTSQALTTAAQVFDTKKSFTVTARVRLGTTTPTGPMTVASVDGPTGSGFRLHYRTDVSVMGSAAAWCFTMFGSDGAADTASTRSCAPAVQTTADWVNLAGVYDATAHTVQVWIPDETGVMIAWEPPTTFTCTWSANGVLAVGRARQSSASTQYFSGSIDRIAVFAKPLSDAEINADKATA